jgi:haloacetate dehalogenase
MSDSIAAKPEGTVHMSDTPVPRDHDRSGAGADSRWFPTLDSRTFEVDGVSIFARYGGAPDRPALLLVHGYPESHVMWHQVAQRLHEHYFLVIPDLRGYGDSSKPTGLPDHGNYSKRAMANDLVAVMDLLGLESFYLCGHDRGGRVSARLALDHSDRVRKLSLLDIAPTLDIYNATTREFATAYFHWFFLIQSEPLPELMIGGNPAQYLSTVLRKLGGSDEFLEAGVADEYERVFCTPEAIHSTTEDSGPAPASTSSTTSTVVSAATRSVATHKFCLLSGEPSTACSMHTHSGKPNAPRP